MSAEFKIALKWMSKQKRARGRPKKNWMESIRKAMNERNLNEGQWEDRKQWGLGSNGFSLNLSIFLKKLHPLNGFSLNLSTYLKNYTNLTDFN
jgi:hypothetical protein